MTMNRFRTSFAYASRCSQLLLAGWLLVAAGAAAAAEQGRGELGSVSEAGIQVSLEVDRGVTAGFLRTNLDSPDSDFRNRLSTRLIQVIREGRPATLPFCILSSGGGSFEITSIDIPGMSQNSLRSQFGARVPLDIRIGEDELEAAKYRAEGGDCNAETALPLTIRLDEQLSGREVGRLYGRFNLLVKTE